MRLPPLSVLLLLHFAAGGLLLLAALAIDSRPELAVHWRGLERPLLVLGGILPCLAGFYRRTTWARRSAVVCLVLSRDYGELPFNGLYDSHLNARGSAAVGGALARRLGLP